MVPYIEAKNHIQSEKAAASHMNDPFGFGPSRTPYESGFLMVCHLGLALFPRPNLPTVLRTK